MIGTTLLAAGLIGEMSWATLREQCQLRWPKNREVRIVCHGHSVPSGYFTAGKVETFKAYPHLLHVALNKNFPYAVINVMRTGIGGENSIQGAARFERDVLSLRPDVVTIDYSLNDRRLDIGQVRMAWKKMAAAAKQQGALVILLTPTPDTNENILDPKAPLAVHATQVRELAKELDVYLVDSYQKFFDIRSTGADLKEYMSQNNHPNKKGHQVVADELEKVFMTK